MNYNDDVTGTCLVFKSFEMLLCLLMLAVADQLFLRYEGHKRKKSSLGSTYTTFENQNEHEGYKRKKSGLGCEPSFLILIRREPRESQNITYFEGGDIAEHRNLHHSAKKRFFDSTHFNLRHVNQFGGHLHVV